ncbi:MAG: phosphatase PAP2 family protein [Anaerolineales bacterium]|nr:phosphatase PAP2 family protein [Anaerolineales bacterium]
MFKQLLVISIFAVALSTAASRFDYFPGDLVLTNAFQSIQFPFLELLMESVSYLGDGLIALLFVLLIAGIFLLQNLRIESIVIFSSLIAAGLNYIVKLAVDRPRPVDDLVIVAHQTDTASFPSGHVVYSFVLFGLLYCLAPRLASGKWGIWAIRLVSILMAVLIGLSRIYLGVHWPSDVIGGLVFGFIYLMIALAFYRRYRVRHIQ